MLVSVVIVFVICITPDAVMTFIGLGYKDASYLVRAIREITDFLLTINSGVNFILYCIFNSMFRKQFMIVFCKRCGGDEGVVTDYEARLFQTNHLIKRRASAPIIAHMNGNTRRMSLWRRRPSNYIKYDAGHTQLQTFV